jgi:hypothetical protein
LGWVSRLKLADGLAWSLEWHRRLNAGAAARVLVSEQLARYGTLQ